MPNGFSPRGGYGAAASQPSPYAAADSAYQQALPGYEKQLASYIDSGDYNNAWQFATTHGNNGQLSQAQQSANNAGNIFAKSYDPLTAMLETSQGLQSLDPNKKWNQSDVSSFYQAANPYWHQDAQVSNGQITNSGLGENPYRNSTGKGTEWGTNANLTQDASTNYSTAPGSAPDLARFAGKSATDPNFLQKYGAPIAAIALACIAPEAIGLLGPMLGGGVLGGAVAGAAVGAAGSAAIDEITGQPLTLKSVGVGAVGGAIGGSGVLSSLNSAVGNVVSDAAGNVVSEGAADTIGNIAGDAVAGAGKGAIAGALTGNSKNIGTGALIGGVGAGIGSGISELGDANGINTQITNAAGKAASTVGTNAIQGKSTSGLGLAEGAATGLAGGAIMGTLTGGGNASDGSGVAGEQSATSPTSVGANYSTSTGNTMSDNSDGLSYVDPNTGDYMTDAQYNQQQTDQYFNGPNPLSDGSGAGTDPTAPPTSSDPGAPPPPSNFSASTPWGNVGSGGSSGSSGSSTQIPGLQQLLSTLGLGSNTNLSTVGGLAGLAALIGKATGATKTSSTAFNPPPLWGSLGQSGSGPSANNTFGAPNKTFQQSPNVDYAHYGESGHTPSQAFFQPAGGASDNGMVAGTQQAGVPVNTGSGAPNGVVGNGSLPPGLLQTLQALNSQGNTPGGQQPSMYGQPPVMLPASGISSAQVQHADGGYIDDDNHYAMGGIAGSADGQPDQSSTTQLNGQLTNGNVNGTHSQPVGGLLSGLQMLQEQMQGNHQTMSPAQPLFGPQQAPMSMEQSGSDFHYHAPNVGGQPSSGLLGMLQSLGGMGGMSQAGVSGGNVAGPLSGLQQASGGMPLAGVMGGGQSPSAAMQQVQSSPYTASPNPAPSPPPLAVQSTANSAPSAQAQPSTPGVTTPAMQQTNPQPNAPAIQQPSSGLSGMLQPGVMGGGASMPMAGSPGIVAQSMRQSYSTPSARMGIQQHGNGDGTQPWHNQMGGWNRERGGPRFADGGLNPADSNVHGEPHPGILDALRQIFLPPPRPTGPPPGRAHGGMAPQVHEQGALGAMAPDMTSHPDHGSNSRHNYTGNMTQSSGRADDINAKLANNEYIMDAETTALAGDGNPDEGARRFDQLREEIRKHKGKALAKGKISPNAKPRLSSYNPAVVS